MLNATLVSAQQPALQQRSYQVHPGQQIVAQVSVFLNHAVLVTQFREPVVSTPTIRQDRAAWFDHVPDRWLQALARCIGDSAESSPANAFVLFLRRDEH